MEFSVQIAGLQALIARLQESPAVAAPILQRAVIASSLILASNTNAQTVPVRTGFLINHFQWVLGVLQGRWYPTASYARYVEFGTAPHRIEAKDKRALFWSGAEHPVRGVNHPGTKANPYMERILAVSADEINTTFDEALDQIVQELANQ
jgi:hypothetical protein